MFHYITKYPYIKHSNFYSLISKQHSMNKLTIVALLPLLFLLSNCQKEAVEVIVPPTKSELLTSGSSKIWIATSIVSDPPIPYGGTVVSDLFAQYEDCEKDDIFNFRSDGSYSVEQGATKCDANSPQVLTNSKWAFNSDESLLIFTHADGDIQEATLSTLTREELQFSFLERGTDLNYKITITLNPK